MRVDTRPAHWPRPTNNNVNHQGSREAPGFLAGIASMIKRLGSNLGYQKNNEFGIPDQRNLHRPEGEKQQE
jgi:hypothetical protein